MKIYYIHHSCFIVESKSSFLIFDYYKSKPYMNDFDFDFKDLIDKIMKSDKAVYIFASHSHNDHYSSEILTWNASKNNVYYMLSDDIEIYNQIDRCYFLKPNQEIVINNLKINTFGSTDAGISIIINLDNNNIFHAGDLNWWKWNDDTPSEEKEMEFAFKSIVNDIINLNINIDIAFFPVDKRLEENFMYGGEFFIEKLSPNIFIPMHFWDNFHATNEFVQLVNRKALKTKVLKIKHANEILI
ncbi:L-ascorbate metabolism protein UlaG (beta-lactamase superfamily) [Sedimentibacter acidaminivorans]|uniref:L-ascorbate metabolism protein UlaG (Beta-lactamase superfamily) n=1 Tax=Sedimentibacter acidaminivorans TaxID=913099 RepID=A0ABS4GHJ0_9FIRM|nr:MBL fold metallo-hydrolase [Sedimentibacter acidaminivorans]MBP1927077.1 L-ascorbate metabolism protein UlaG (beta-lactamase superfamily) [Sedimentibacter acidaminivorans]